MARFPGLGHSMYRGANRGIGSAAFSKSESVWVLSLRSMTGQYSHVHEFSLCRAIQSLPPCHCQAEIKRLQIVLDRSQPGLPRSIGFASPVSGRTPNAGQVWVS